MKYLLISLALLICVPSVFIQSTRAQEAELKIGMIKDSDVPTEESCACRFNYSSSGLTAESHLLWAAAAPPYTAFMNINGRVTTLRRISSTWTQKYSMVEKKGSSFVETYRSGDVRVRITYVVSRKDAGSESALYSATIVVTKGNRSKTLRTFGGCAC